MLKWRRGLRAAVSRGVSIEWFSVACVMVSFFRLKVVIDGSGRTTAPSCTCTGTFDAGSFAYRGPVAASVGHSCMRCSAMAAPTMRCGGQVRRTIVRPRRHPPRTATAPDAQAPIPLVPLVRVTLACPRRDQRNPNYDISVTLTMI